MEITEKGKKEQKLFDELIEKYNYRIDSENRYCTKKKLPGTNIYVEKMVEFKPEMYYDKDKSYESYWQMSFKLKSSRNSLECYGLSRNSKDGTTIEEKLKELKKNLDIDFVPPKQYINRLNFNILKSKYRKENKVEIQLNRYVKSNYAIKLRISNESLMSLIDKDDKLKRKFEEIREILDNLIMISKV